MRCPSAAQDMLCDIFIFLKEFSDAETRIYHGIPSFFYGKRGVINVGAYKGHIGLHVGYGAVDYLKQKHPAFGYTKSTIQFKYGEPLPLVVLGDICGFIKNDYNLPG